MSCQILDCDIIAFCCKMSYLLATKCAGVTKDDLLSTIPKPEELKRMFRSSTNGATGGFIQSPFLLAAFVCEMLGADDQTGQYKSCAHTSLIFEQLCNFVRLPTYFKECASVCLQLNT